MKLFWYLSTIILICLILLNYPQKGNLATLNNEIKFLNSTSNAQRGLQTVIMVNITIFFLLTIFIVINT